MKRLHFTFETLLEFSAPVQRHYFTLRCLPAALPRQRLVSESITIGPGANFAVQQDGFGNRLVCGEQLAPHNAFTYRVEGLALVENTRSDGLHPMYSVHSSRCRPTPEILSLYQSIPLEGAALRRAFALSEAVHSSLSYQPGSTTLATTAGQALAQGAGVCQDYTQLLLTLLRLEGIPARYCSGLVPGTGTTHAWAEAFVEGRWLGVDPTRNCPADERYLVLAVGRDSADCLVEQGIFWGNAAQRQQITATLKEG